MDVESRWELEEILEQLENGNYKVNYIVELLRRCLVILVKEKIKDYYNEEN